MSNEEVEMVNKVCYFLIHKCIEANAGELKITQTNVHRKDEQFGDWEIVVKKKTA